jgi:hypothetical protein
MGRGAAEARPQRRAAANSVIPHKRTDFKREPHVAAGARNRKKSRANIDRRVDHP